MSSFCMEKLQEFFLQKFLQKFFAKAIGLCITKCQLRSLSFSKVQLKCQYISNLFTHYAYRWPCLNQYSLYEFCKDNSHDVPEDVKLSLCSDGKQEKLKAAELQNYCYTERQLSFCHDRYLFWKNYETSILQTFTFCKFVHNSITYFANCNELEHNN